LRAQVQRLWDRGEILASVVTGESPFPRRLVLKRPTAAELLDRFDEARAWIAQVRGQRHCRVEMREVGHRVLGANVLPHEVWIDTCEDALAFVGRQREAARFDRLVTLTRDREPRLLGWLAQRPLRALQLADDWPRLLDIIDWVAATPRPGIYLRQVDLPGIHTKFIEAHRGVLTELLDGVLPPEAIDQGASSVGQFARRYGFLDKPERIRFRILDPRHALLPGGKIQDITLDAPSFAGLDCGCSRVLITENEINFLALPPMRDTLVIFGAGYGFDTLGRTPWLAGRRIHYWGDIDTHGFAILDQLRSRLGQVESFLMDRATLMAFEPHWGLEQKPTPRDLPRLTEEERALYDDLRDNRIRSNLRLEQERIGFRWVEAALARLEEC
ncbi:MAG: DUF3322 domain-containing protein, partial [Chromatiaceae bacterium]